MKTQSKDRRQRINDRAASLLAMCGLVPRVIIGGAVIWAGVTNG